MSFNNLPFDQAENVYKDKINLLFITATQLEMTLMNSSLVGFSYDKKKIKTSKENQTYYLGKFGAYLVVHVNCNNMGQGFEGSLNTVRDAIEDWSPKAVVMLGVAMGRSEKKTPIGTVLISEAIVPYEIERLGTDNVIFRSSIPPAGKILLNRFKNTIQFYHGSSVKSGHILSGDKLVDDPVFKKQLLDKHPNAIGLEMEGAGLYSGVRGSCEWLLVKGVCDFGDGEKSKNKKENQTKAMASVIDFSSKVFESKYDFIDLGLTAYSDQEDSRQSFKDLFGYDINKIYEPLKIVDLTAQKEVDMLYIIDKLKPSNVSFLLGRAGVGKSISTQFIYESIKSTNNDEQIFYFVAKDLAMNKGLAEFKSCKVIIDGYDELNINERSDLSIIIDNLARNHNKILITSRHETPLPYKYSFTSDKYEIIGWSWDSILKVSEKVLKNISEEKSNELHSLYVREPNDIGTPLILMALLTLQDSAKRIKYEGITKTILNVLDHLLNKATSGGTVSKDTIKDILFETINLYYENNKSLSRIELSSKLVENHGFAHSVIDEYIDLMIKSGLIRRNENDIYFQYQSIQDVIIASELNRFLSKDLESAFAFLLNKYVILSNSIFEHFISLVDEKKLKSFYLLILNKLIDEDNIDKVNVIIRLKNRISELFFNSKNDDVLSILEYDFNKEQIKNNNYASICDGYIEINCIHKIKIGSPYVRDFNELNIINIENFRIDIYPVTNYDFLEYIVAKKAEIPFCNDDHEKTEWDHYRSFSDNELILPVTCISHEEAVEYCKWKGGRLPKAEEIELASGGLTGVRYVKSNNFKNVEINVKGLTQGGHNGKCGVNEYENESVFGIKGILGNIWEWTNSLESKNAIVKGGSYDYGIAEANICFRYFDSVENRSPNLGFRVAYDF